MPPSIHASSPVRALLGLALALAWGCAGEEARDAGPSTAEEWASARAVWNIERDPSAFSSWNTIDPASPEGREAQRLLAEADPLYRRGIDEVSRGRAGARDTFERAVRVAPMDPALYLPLARAFRDQGRRHPDNAHLFIRAAEYYRKFLVLTPHAPEAEVAREELAEIDPDGSRLFAPPPIDGGLPEAPTLAEAPEPPSWPLWVAFSALGLALAAFFVARARTKTESLTDLAERRPELHPAIAYLVGSLRHELLKHRIGAVGNAVDAMRGGNASEAQQEFLRGRLYGGEPLTSAWEGHLSAFERALGPELDLRRSDPHFRDGAKAISTIARLEPKVQRGDARAIARLSASHTKLRDFDHHLSRLAHRLVRTSVDGALFRDIVDEVRSEYAAGEVALDEVVIRAPEPAPMVEVFRVDLVLILKNVVRNAILAVGGDEPPRRIGLDVETEVELTGEETVRIHVRDTAPGELSTEDIYARRMSRGLGLVTAALSRYDGAIAVEPSPVEASDGEWAKSVVIRFFRAYDEE